MGRGNANYVSLGIAGQTALRVLIASYFIAVSLGLIGGTDLSILFSGVLSYPHDGATAAAFVFVCSFMIMIGLATRAAALLLALMTFYASYLSMIALGVEEEIGSFWRDLALIAALLLTYSEPQTGSRPRRRIISRAVAPRRVAPVHARVGVTERAERPAPALNLAALRARATHVGAAELTLDEVENIFAEDAAA